MYFLLLVAFKSLLGCPPARSVVCVQQLISSSSFEGRDGRGSRVAGELVWEYVLCFWEQGLRLSKCQSALSSLCGAPVCFGCDLSWCLDSLCGGRN